tara:strand:- start:36 stop:4922 length:4887 start_codon:yes stop_codon:yes gene_type:complete
MTRSYFDPYANPEFQKGTSEEDMEAYDQMVETKKQQVKDGTRSESYIDALKTIEANKQAAAEEGIETFSGLDPDQINQALELQVEYEQPEGSEVIGFPTDTGLESQSGLDPETAAEPITDEDGFTLFDDVPENYRGKGSRTAFDLDSDVELQAGAREVQDPFDPTGFNTKNVKTRLLSENTHYVADSFEANGGQISDLEERLISPMPETIIGALYRPDGTPNPSYSIVLDAVNEINNTDTPEYQNLRNIYGGEDGIIQPEEIMQDRSTQGTQGMPGTVYHDNLLAKRFSRRNHALTRTPDLDLRGNLTEAENAISDGLAKLGRATLSFVERSWDENTGRAAYNKEGLLLDTRPDSPYYMQPYQAEFLDNFPSLRDWKPWIKTGWGQLASDAAFHLPVLGATYQIGIGPSGMGNPFAWKGLPFKGLRSPAAGGILRDSLAFLPGNMLWDSSPFNDNRYPYSPAFVNAALEQNIPLVKWKSKVPEVGESSQLLASGWNSHPTVVRLTRITRDQGVDALGTGLIATVGGAVFKPRRALDNIFGSRWNPISYSKEYKGLLGKQYQIGRAHQGIGFGRKDMGPSLERMVKEVYEGPLNTGKPFKGIMNNIESNNQWLFKRNEARRKVDVDMARSQLNDPEAWTDSSGLLSSRSGGYKLNESFKQPGQGTSYPVGKPAEILDAANTKTLESPLGVSGSTDQIFTPLQTRRIAIDGIRGNNLNDLTQKLLDDVRYQKALRGLPKAKRTIGQLYELVLERQQKMLSRDASKLSSEEFWGPTILKQTVSAVPSGKTDELTTWYLDNIVSADNINSAIFTALRDHAVAAREIEKTADIFTADGPISNLVDNLIVGLSNVKRSRLLWRELGPAGREGKLTREALLEIQELVDARSDLLSKDTKEAVGMMMKLVKHRNSDEVANGLLEMFSMSNDIHNWTDFDAWMKAKLFGGEFAGKTGDGVLIHEMQGVMMNSILSGPKTPMRALMGTVTNSYANAINEAAGALIRTPFTDDIVSRRAALAKAKAFFELIPESWTMLRRNMSANWSGDIKTIKSRYYTQRGGKSEENWELFKAYGEAQDNVGVQAAINVGDVGKTLNDSKWTTANIRIMASIDDTARWLLARARSKEKALREILDQAGDDFAEITPEILSKAEDIHYSHLLDSDGNIDLNKDAWLRKQFEEVTLTEDIGKLGEALNKVFEIIPLAKPFYLFARSGINGLKVSFKNTPAVSLLMKESRAILQHKGTDFSKLAEFGIENSADLANARNLFAGRQAVGSAVAIGIFTKYAAGELTGSGPADKQLRQSWINSGWKPNTITFGDVVFDYSSLEPYNLMFSAIADIGDNGQLMGDEWAEKRMQAIGYVIGRGLTGKTYLSGLDQMMQMVQGRNWNKNIANILNNSLPLAGLRNEVGKFLNPHMKELNSSMWSSIRNRNQYAEGLARVNPWLDPLVEKADILNGQPINNWNFVQRGFNAISPVQINIKSKSPGRTFLQQSGYDQKSTVYGYDGYSFTRSATVRALFQTAMGKARIKVGHKTYRNLEHYLDVLSKDPTIIASMAQMRRDANDPTKWDLDPSTAYNHNLRIDEGFDAARAQAWAAIKDHPRVLEIIQEQNEAKRKKLQSRNETSPFAQRDALLNIPK